MEGFICCIGSFDHYHWPRLKLKDLSNAVWRAPVLVLMHRARLPLVEEEEDEHEVHDEPGDSQPRGEGICLGERLGRKSSVFAQLVNLAWF